MMYKKNATVLVPTELMYAFTQLNNQCGTNSKNYQKGYLMGMSDGYHKGYSDALAYEDLQFSGLDDDDGLPDCTGLCKACPHYDDLFGICKF